MWVERNNNAGFDGRPLPWVEEVSKGQVVASVLGRRTNQTFRQLQKLLLTQELPLNYGLRTHGDRRMVGLF